MGKKILRSPALTVVLFVAAAALLFGGTIGAVQAAPRSVSSDYIAQVQLDNALGVKVVENGEEVSGDDALLKSLVAEGETFKVGVTYPEELKVSNTGNADEYVRVTVRRYWSGEDGKSVDLDPGLIGLNFVEDGGWEIDQSASTRERTVLYYSEPIAPGESTSAFIDSLTVDGSVIRSVTQLANGDNEFDYGDANFHLEAKADSVQSHNHEDAMASVWGYTHEEGE